MKIEINIPDDKNFIDYALLNRIGNALETGDGADQDLESAFQLYKTGADDGDPVSKHNLANMYIHGRFVKKDVKHATELLLEAAEEGEGLAMLSLGNIAEFGWLNDEVDYDEAFFWYSEAAKTGLLDGIYNYANCFHHGYGTDINHHFAFTLFQSLADNKEYPPAFFYMGLYYQEGLAVEKDYLMALLYYKRGARLGDALCFHQLGVMYGKGLGVDMSQERAVAYYKAAAELGDPLSYTCLAYAYEYGEGVEADFEKAVSMYQIAASTGEKNALEALERLNIDVAETHNTNTSN